VNLQEFVTQALVQIASGIRDADEQLRKAGAIVNPRHVTGSGADKTNVYGYLAENKEYLRAVHSVDFDVAVTAVEGKETKGGIGIVVGAIGIGSHGRSEESSTSVSRIKFRVPIALPNAVNET
jgi:hypothetical protein